MLMESDDQHANWYLRPGLWDEALWQWQTSHGDLTHQAPQSAQAQHPEVAPSAWCRHDVTQQGPQIRQLCGCGHGTDLQGPAPRAGRLLWTWAHGCGCGCRRGTRSARGAGARATGFVLVGSTTELDFD